MIQPVESLEITVLVDNGTDSLSTNPGFVETEMAGAWRRGMKWLSGRCLCSAAHGLSCLITTRTPSSQHTLLFDTGPAIRSSKSRTTTLPSRRHDNEGSVHQQVGQGPQPRGACCDPAEGGSRHSEALSRWRHRADVVQAGRPGRGVPGER